MMISRLFLSILFSFLCEGAFLYKTNLNHHHKTSVQSALNANRNNFNKRLTPADALALRKEAEQLRQEAKALEQALQIEKETRIQKERIKIDTWIDQLLVQQNISDTIQMLNSETQVAQLLIDMRFDEEGVNKIFDRICETTLRRQSIDNCSPLISLLLDAACKVDCMERDENPNKRWRTRVESRLREKLFLLGYGIILEDAEADRDPRKRSRSITGDRDIF